MIGWVFRPGVCILELVHGAVPFNDPPSSVHRSLYHVPQMSTRRLDPCHVTTLSDAFCSWRSLNPAKHASRATTALFYVSQHSPRTPALADTHQMTYCHCVKREWGVTDELEHPPIHRLGGKEGKNTVKNLYFCTFFFSVNLHHSTNLTTCGITGK